MNFRLPLRKLEHWKHHKNLHEYVRQNPRCIYFNDWLIFLIKGKQFSLNPHKTSNPASMNSECWWNSYCHSHHHLHCNYPTPKKYELKTNCNIKRRLLLTQVHKQ